MIDSFQTILAEIEYGISILRPHYPEADDDWLKARALFMRPESYRTGRWPTDEELAATKVVEELAEAARKAAEEKAMAEASASEAQAEA